MSLMVSVPSLSVGFGTFFQFFLQKHLAQSTKVEFGWRFHNTCGKGTFERVHKHTHTLGCHWNKGSWMNIGQHCMHTSDPIHNYSKAVKIISNCTHKQAYLLNNTMFPLMNNTITRWVTIVLEYSILHRHNNISNHNLSMCTWVSFPLFVCGGFSCNQ